MMIDIRATKTGLAKLLAGENISVQHKKVRTASFDVKNRILTLPLYKKDINSEVYDTFVAHEVGHALYTPNDPDIFKDKALFRYINLVEDIRIERMIKNKFPGLVKSFYLGYQQLQKDNFFGISESEIPDLCFGDRLNLNAKIGSEGFFTEKEESLVKMAKSAIGFSEVVEAAKAIKEYEDSIEEEEQEEQESNDESGDGESSEEESEGNDSPNDSEKEKKEESKDPSSDGNSKKKEKKDKEKEEEEESAGGKSSTTNEEGEESEDSTENSNPSNEGNKKDEEKKSGQKKEKKEMKTDSSAEGNYDNFLDNKSADNNYYTVANLNLDNIIIDPKKIAADLFSVSSNDSDKYRSEFENFKLSNQKVVNYLHKEFEMKKNAEQHKRSSESTSGTLDTTRMFRYKYDDNIFKKIASVPNGKSHGLVMYVDWSGSMSNKIVSTVKQAITLALFCKRAGIAFEIYAFTEIPSNKSVFYTVKNPAKNQLVVKGDFRLLNFVSSKMSGQKFNEALYNFWRISKAVINWGDRSRLNQDYNLTGTPLNQALLVAPSVIEKFRNINRVQVVHLVVITDGLATDNLWTPNTYNDGVIPANTVNGYIRHGHKNYPMYKGDKTHYNNRCNTYEITNPLIDYVKEVAKVNVIGFGLVTGSPEFTQTYRAVTESNDYKKTFAEQNRFSSQKNIAIETKSYNEFFIIKADKSLDIKIEGFEDKEYNDIKEAVKEVRKQFKSIGNSLKTQRVILNKFVASISAPSMLF